MGRPVQVDGRTVVITGAGSGIGRALAQRLARHGCPLALVDSDEAGLADTAASVSTPVLHRKLDVRDRQAQLTFAAEVKAWTPAPLGFVINNAGVTVSQDTLHAAPEDDEWVLDVNLGGVINGTRAWLPLLAEQGSGALVNVSSVFGLIGWPTQAAYCASKFAVRGWTEAIRHELRGTDVRAISVHPGAIATSIVANARFHVDDRGRTDRTELEKDFTAIARTSPEKAAAVIHRGVAAGRERILIGPEAYALAGLLRLAPIRYFDVIKRLEPLVRRS